jgi:hypothetical protein
MAELERLLASPELAAEGRGPGGSAGSGRPGGVCNDGFVVSIQTPAWRVRSEDCGGSAEQPATAAVAALLLPLVRG